MDSISSDIKKGNIKRVYLFYGEDTYKRRVYKDLLKKTLFSNEMNYSYFEGDEVDLKKVYDSCMAVPFFADKRLIIVENSGLFKTKGQSRAKGSDEELLELLNAVPPSSCLAFFEEEAAKNKKIYKEISKNGVALECGHDSEQTVAAWLKKGFEQARKKADNSAVYYLIERIGTDYEQLKKEFDKLISYCADSQIITKADIDAVTGQNTDAKVYEIINACAAKNPRLMLEKYYALVENDVYPLIILAGMRNQFELFLQIAELANKGLSDEEIAKKLGKSSYVIRNNKKTIKNFRLSEIEKIIEEITLTDKKIKDGDMDERTGTELLLIKISMGDGNNG